MNQKISHITIVVDDYDKAIEFYTKNLNLNFVKDKKSYVKIIDATKERIKKLSEV